MEETMHFMCTAGRGSEMYVRKELCKFHGVEHADGNKGKVFFYCQNNFLPLLQLKTAERLFILIMCEKECLGLFNHKFQGLRKKLDGTNTWQRQFGLWKRFQHEKQLVLVNNESDRTDNKQLIAKTVGNNDCLQEEECDKSVRECDNLTVKMEHNVRKRAIDESVSAESVKISKLTQDNITFRLSLKCSGAAASLICTEDMTRFMGGYVSHRFGWHVDLRNPKLEIYMNINDDDGLIIGLPVTKEPLSKRSYLKHIGIRSTVAFIMAQAADINVGDVVLDPMCGTATLLVEAAVNFKHNKCIGCDISSNMLKIAEENVTFAELSSVSLMHCNAKYMPLKDQSVDRILCDMPFGECFGEVDSLKCEYPSLLQSMNRVLKPGGKCVVLTGEVLKPLLIKTVCSSTKTGFDEDQRLYDQRDTRPLWRVFSWIPLNIQYFKLGETRAYMCVFEKPLICCHGV